MVVAIVGNTVVVVAGVEENVKFGGAPAAGTVDVVTTVDVGVGAITAVARELNEKLVFRAETCSAGLAAKGAGLGAEVDVTAGNARPNDGVLKLLVGFD